MILFAFMVALQNILSLAAYRQGSEYKKFQKVFKSQFFLCSRVEFMRIWFSEFCYFINIANLTVTRCKRYPGPIKQMLPVDSAIIL